MVVASGSTDDKSGIVCAVQHRFRGRRMRTPPSSPESASSVKSECGTDSRVRESVCVRVCVRVCVCVCVP